MYGVWVPNELDTERRVQRTLLFGPYSLRILLFAGHGGGGAMYLAREHHPNSLWTWHHPLKHCILGNVLGLFAGMDDRANDALSKQHWAVFPPVLRRSQSLLVRGDVFCAVLAHALTQSSIHVLKDFLERYKCHSRLGLNLRRQRM